MSSSLSPIFYLFLGPSSILYLKVQHLLAEDELLQGSNSPHQKSTTKSNHPNTGIPADQWPTIVHRVVEQKEPFAPSQSQMESRMKQFAACSFRFISNMGSKTCKATDTAPTTEA